MQLEQSKEVGQRKFLMRKRWEGCPWAMDQLDARHVGPVLSLSALSLVLKLPLPFEKYDSPECGMMQENMPTCKRG